MNTCISPLSNITALNYPQTFYVDNDRLGAYCCNRPKCLWKFWFKMFYEDKWDCCWNVKVFLHFTVYKSMCFSSTLCPLFAYTCSIFLR